MKRISIFFLLLLICFSPLWGQGKDTHWCGKTINNLPVMLEKGILYCIKPEGKCRLFILGGGPKGGFGRWQYFIDETGTPQFVLKGVCIDLRKYHSRCRGGYYYRWQPYSTPLDEPNEAYEGGARGNAQLPTMDDDFPYVAF